MQNVKQEKTVEELTPLEALNELKGLFANIQNPFQGTAAQVQAQLSGVYAMFEKVASALEEEN